MKYAKYQILNMSQKVTVKSSKKKESSAHVFV